MEITVSGTREWRLLGGVLRQCQLDVESTSGGLGNVGGVGTPNHQCSSRFMMRSSQCARAHQRPAQRLGVGVECAGVVGGPRRRRVASVWNRRAILRDVCWRMLGLIGNPTWQLVQSVGVAIVAGRTRLGSSLLCVKRGGAFRLFVVLLGYSSALPETTVHAIALNGSVKQTRPRLKQKGLNKKPPRPPPSLS